MDIKEELKAANQITDLWDKHYALREIGKAQEQCGGREEKEVK
jgi:hypothetical protein